VSRSPKKRRLQAGAKGSDIRSRLFTVAGVAIIAGLVYYLVVNADRYVDLLQISAPGVLALMVLTLIFSVLNGVFNTYMFRAVGAEIAHSEGFLLTAVATLANQLPLPAGIVTRAVYLKRQHGLSYTHYLSSQLAVVIGVIAVDGFIGLGILSYWFLFTAMDAPSVLFAAFGLMALSAAAFWFPLERIHLPAAIQARIGKAVEGWKLISGNPRLLARLFGLKMATTLIVAVRYWLAFHMLSQAVTGGQVMLFAVASVLTQLVSFAPGNLGVREAIVGAVAVALRFDLAVSVAAVGLDRLAATSVYVILGWISALLLGRRLSGGIAAEGTPNE